MYKRVSTSGGTGGSSFTPSTGSKGSSTTRGYTTTTTSGTNSSAPPSAAGSYRTDSSRGGTSSTSSKPEAGGRFGSQITTGLKSSTTTTKISNSTYVRTTVKTEKGKPTESKDRTSLPPIRGGTTTSTKAVSKDENKTATEKAPPSSGAPLTIRPLVRKSKQSNSSATSASTTVGGGTSKTSPAIRKPLTPLSVLSGKKTQTSTNPGVALSSTLAMVKKSSRQPVRLPTPEKPLALTLKVVLLPQIMVALKKEFTTGSAGVKAIPDAFEIFYKMSAHYKGRGLRVVQKDKAWKTTCAVRATVAATLPLDFNHDLAGIGYWSVGGRVSSNKKNWEQTYFQDKKKSFPPLPMRNKKQKDNERILKTAESQGTLYWVPNKAPELNHFRCPHCNKVNALPVEVHSLFFICGVCQEQFDIREPQGVRPPSPPRQPKPTTTTTTTHDSKIASSNGPNKSTTRGGAGAKSSSSMMSDSSNSGKMNMANVEIVKRKISKVVGMKGAQERKTSTVSSVKHSSDSKVSEGSPSSSTVKKQRINFR